VLAIGNVFLAGKTIPLKSCALQEHEGSHNYIYSATAVVVLGWVVCIRMNGVVLFSSKKLKPFEAKL